MDVLFENWFFIALLLVCIGMHFFMHGRHGHGHGHQHHDHREHDQHGHGGKSPKVDPR